MDKITPRADLHFTGAKSGKPYHLRARHTVEMDAADLAHLDPKDFTVGEKAEEPEPAKGKKK